MALISPKNKGKRSAPGSGADNGDSAQERILTSRKSGLLISLCEIENGFPCR
jgi:hypothetical protein